ncbi:hypothetical protein CR203_03285 [Salipaludibacillus neizhouensis]|uniref:SAM-dependent methyltransferase n=1 Tax=Salipaludibacillus neizhouensis TaxID=885475 RepID=A0A3A9KA51_9BACI|nr:class I SAM-dependent methyltransferase [Salipaludibacillus neizhouensis]RKL69079.1 hypothetical protein CR203_03285 [Salipaludibacillus neizhouensis]
MERDGFVTSSSKAAEDIKKWGRKLAEKWSLPYVVRRKQPIDKLIRECGGPAYVVTTTRIEVYRKEGSQPFFFHPNAAMFRAKRWLYHQEDPFVSACDLREGDILVDATLGLGSDVQLASLAIGKQGNVIGLEASEVIFTIVEEGLQSYESSLLPLNEAMRRIKVIHTNAENWLKEQPDASVDVVYFDPMFQEEVSSDGIETLKQYGLYEGDFEQMIIDAIRVARKKVVLKDHFKSTRFALYGFHVQVRPSSVFHYGIIDLEERE